MGQVLGSQPNHIVWWTTRYRAGRATAVEVRGWSLRMDARTSTIEGWLVDARGHLKRMQALAAAVPARRVKVELLVEEAWLRLERAEAAVERS